MALLQTVAGEEGLSSIALTQVYGTAGFWARRGFHDVSEPGMARRLASYGADPVVSLRPDMFDRDRRLCPIALARSGRNVSRASRAC